MLAAKTILTGDPPLVKVLVPASIREPMPAIDGVDYITVDPAAPVPGEHLDAEVLVVWDQPRAVLNECAARMGRLRLVQGLQAGPDAMLAAGFAPDVRLASGVGLHDGPVAEHALGLALALLRHLPLALQRMGERVWDGHLGGVQALRAEDGRITTLQGAAVTIWGFGSIASRLAPLLSSLGANVTGVARSAGERHGYPVVAEEDLAELLGRTDLLVMILPNSPATTHALDAERLAQLRAGALLINVGRGVTVDEAALMEALASGRLAAAAIDVAHSEPLPASSPLWRAPNLVITPHIAGGRPQRPGVLLGSNIAALEGGERLINQIG